MTQTEKTIFQKDDVVVAKNEFLEPDESLYSTLAIVLDYNPKNDYLKIGSLVGIEKLYSCHVNNIPYFLHIGSMRGECYRLVTVAEKQKWNIQ